MVHIDTKKLDAGLVAATPQPTGFTYYQNDRNAYEVILTIGNLEQSLKGCNAYIIWTYEDGSTTMQEAVVEPPKTIRHILSPALLAKTGQVVCTLVVYDEAQSYRRTLGQWLCQVLPEAEEPTVPPEDPDVPIIQSLLLDAQRLDSQMQAALDRAEAVEQGTQTAKEAAEAAQANAEAALSATETVTTAARQSAQDAAQSAAAAGNLATAAAQSAAQASNNAADAQSAKLDAQTAQAGAEVARDQAQNTVAAMVPNTRTVNGKALSSDITLTAGDVGAVQAGMASGYDLPLSATHTESWAGSSFYTRNQFGEVTISFDVKKADGSALGTAWFATIPPGFRPVAQVSGVGVVFDGSGAFKKAILVSVVPDGNVAIYMPGDSNNHRAAGLVHYLATNV